MILEEFIEIKWHNFTKRHYEDLGYKYTGVGDLFLISTLHLPSMSGIKVKAKCEYCNQIRIIYRQKYTECCNNCKAIKISKSLSKSVINNIFTECMEYENCVKIELSQGQYAIIDKHMMEKVSIRKWYARRFKNDKYYAYAKIGTKCVGLHRLIMGIDNPEIEVDHINRDTLDNRVENLRICSRSENQRNKAKANIDCTSIYKGVHFSKNSKKWVAHISLNGIQTKLGEFNDEISAARAYNKAAPLYHGEFARLNEL